MSPIACNIYIAAVGGVSAKAARVILGRQHRDLVLNLVQHWISSSDRQLHSVDGVELVHVFSDSVYQRSSFHFASNNLDPAPLANAAYEIARLAIQQTEQFFMMQEFLVDGSPADEETQTHHHPYVGPVDHISVFPIQGKVQDFQSTKLCPSVLAAQQIGDLLSKDFANRNNNKIDVLYYGHARNPPLSLALVRKEQTTFFESGSLQSKSSTCETSSSWTTIVGAPDEFVENYNIRLRATTPKIARSLTQKIRQERSVGNLVGVEALTLPYSQSRWEVACNLLQPSAASIHDIDKVVQDWAQQNSPNAVVEQSYRVGTTPQQCLKVLRMSVEERAKHYQSLPSLVKSYFANEE